MAMVIARPPPCAACGRPACTCTRPIVYLPADFAEEAEDCQIWGGKEWGLWHGAWYALDQHHGWASWAVTSRSPAAQGGDMRKEATCAGDTM